MAERTCSKAAAWGLGRQGGDYQTGEGKAAAGGPGEQLGSEPAHTAKVPALEKKVSEPLTENLCG